MKSNNTHRFLGIYVQILPHVMEEGAHESFLWAWRSLAKVNFLAKNGRFEKKKIRSTPIFVYIYVYHIIGGN